MFSPFHGPSETTMDIGSDRTTSSMERAHSTRLGMSVRFITVTSTPSCPIEIWMFSFMDFWALCTQSLTLASLTVMSACEATGCAQFHLTPIGHSHSTCWSVVTVPCLRITLLTPLIPCSKMYFLYPDRRLFSPRSCFCASRLSVCLFFLSSFLSVSTQSLVPRMICMALSVNERSRRSIAILVAVVTLSWPFCLTASPYAAAKTL